MDFTLIESLQAINKEVDQTAQAIVESITIHPAGKLIAERADIVLGQLAAKLQAGKRMDPAEIEEYAAIYASLAMLAQPDVRAGFNIDTSTPEGKQKFARIINHVGNDQFATDNLKRVATINGQSKLRQVKSDLERFTGLDPTQQRMFLNQINKLRIGYERAKNQLDSLNPA